MTEPSQTDTGSDPRSFGRARTSAGPTIGPVRPRSFRLSRTAILRLFILVLAAASGYGALKMASQRQDAPPQPFLASAPAPAPLETEDVLITAQALALGKLIAPDDLAWVAWPKTLVAEHAIRRSAAPKAREDMTGALVRMSMLKGEPVRSEKIVRTNGASMLAAMLPQGYRAVAITIDAQGATSAGGFILPNDRVDIIRTMARNDAQRPGESRIESETLIANVRVLAIGQNIQERNGERVVTGSNATLEVDPSQAELLAQAQRSGQISLALRSIADTGTAPETLGANNLLPGGNTDPTVLNVGVLRAGKRHEYPVPEVRN